MKKTKGNFKVIKIVCIISRYYVNVSQINDDS